MLFKKNNGICILVGIFFIITVGCDSDSSPQGTDGDNESSEFSEYFLEVAFGAEFESDYSNARKWEEDVRIYVPDTSYPELMEELDRVIKELNNYSEGISLKQVSEQSESNYIIYFGDADTYVSEYESNAEDHIENNYGLFWIYWNSGYEINEGSMYVDVYRTEDLDCQKHLLREELTQSLGLMNDSDKYSDSIFYKDWTCNTSYSEMDEKVIETFQSSDIEAGMERKEVTNMVE